jgi:glycyl-radical enzyme activating protein
MTAGMVFDIQRYSLHDGPGLRTLVFLKGCALRCVWCSNPESQHRTPDMLYDAARCTRCGACVRACPSGALLLSDDGAIMYDEALCDYCGACVGVCNQNARRLAGELMTDEHIVAAVVRDMPFYRRSGGGVTLGGGEPTQQAEFARAILCRLKARGVDTAVETCGQADPADFLSVTEQADHVLFDIKHAGSARHIELTGAGNELLLANLDGLLRRDVDVTVRYPLVPHRNDSEADLGALADLLRAMPRVPPVELVPYHRYGEHKYSLLRREYALAGTLPPVADSIDHACGILHELGLACSSLSH